MPEFDLSAIFALPLNRSGVPYMIVGSVAAISYGVHRLTNDLNAVLQMSAGDVRRVHSAFPEKDFYVPPIEILIAEVRRRDRGHFNVIHHASGYKADVFLRAIASKKRPRCGVDNSVRLFRGVERRGMVDGSV